MGYADQAGVPPGRATEHLAPSTKKMLARGKSRLSIRKKECPTPVRLGILVVLLCGCGPCSLAVRGLFPGLAPSERPARGRYATMKRRLDALKQLHTVPVTRTLAVRTWQLLCTAASTRASNFLAIRPPCFRAVEQPVGVNSRALPCVNRKSP